MLNNPASFLIYPMLTQYLIRYASPANIQEQVKSWELFQSCLKTYLFLLNENHTAILFYILYMQDIQSLVLIHIWEMTSPWLLKGIYVQYHTIYSIMAQVFLFVCFVFVCVWGGGVKLFFVCLFAWVLLFCCFFL